MAGPTESCRVNIANANALVALMALMTLVANAHAMVALVALVALNAIQIFIGFKNGMINNRMKTSLMLIG